MMRTEWIELPGKPLNRNAISNSSHWAVTNERKRWRTAAHEYAKYTRIKPFDRPVVIHVRQSLVVDRRPDAGANFEAAKGFADGLVDAGVLEDDGPEFVYGLFFHRATSGTRDSLVLEIQEVGSMYAGHEEH